ncbi:Bax inhibitor-1/YccA family protein [Frankia sp. CNm7]|uniref:Bax inhibitor-1/YccA family protein n=1 Tax=Frankia nepalensis TaxID=1836974 RepID=A0A937RNN3_9ACTN|nr:Bax inhibitor-1/YccA family protein [Frankia nepalensis]MBL7498580.1 Bax inhibitor-1/YccA family protein [Frankia nepalensis]MBL7515041.1 Bax inhibitor-1/YccA family protein [Frankia nepalensis]MBL7519413.1 Bax inhibitor-1/YccA family protein [Frankia nepalensis]MBL7629171.1 Bax inhibitor-1/YccA family protein [Frankia nepalensis]
MARIQSTNPVFTRMRSAAPRRDEATWPPSAQGAPPGYGQPGYGQPGFGQPPDSWSPANRQPGLTIDDVVVHTLGLFGIAGVGGAAGWLLLPSSPGLVLGAGIAALLLSLFIGFTGRINPPLVIVFAVLAGIGAGGASRQYESLYSGIIAQALLGTAVIFVTMLIAYRSRRIRATPRMARVVGGVLLTVIALTLVDLVLRLTSAGQLPVMNDATPLGILFSVVVLIFASLQFILDFDYIEQAIAARAPRAEAWRAAYGLLVGFLWVYLEMLRLLSKLRR